MANTVQKIFCNLHPAFLNATILHITTIQLLRPVNYYYYNIYRIYSNLINGFPSPFSGPGSNPGSHDTFSYHVSLSSPLNWDSSLDIHLCDFDKFEKKVPWFGFDVSSVDSGYLFWRQESHRSDAGSWWILSRGT